MANIFLKDIINFFNQNNIFPTIIATVMSTYVTELTTSFTDNIILPIINRDADNDGVADIKTLEKFELKILKINFKIGKFFVVIIKVLLIFLILFALDYSFKSEKDKFIFSRE